MTWLAAGERMKTSLKNQERAGAELVPVQLSDWPDPQVACCGHGQKAHLTGRPERGVKGGGQSEQGPV